MMAGDERVLLVNTTLSGGGAEYQWRLLARGLSGLGYQVHLATVVDGDDPYEQELSDQGVTCHKLALGFKAALSRRARASAVLLTGAGRLRRLVQQLNPKVVYSALTISNLLARAACAGSGAQLVWGIRGLRDPFPFLPGLALSILEKSTSRGVPLIITNSQAGREHHEQRGLLPRHWAVVHNGFDLARFQARPAARARLREAWGVAPGDIVIGCVARFVPQKGHSNLFAAMAQLTERYPKLTAVLVGGGTGTAIDAMRQSIAEHGLAGRIISLGAEQHVEDYYSAFDLHVLPSLSESFPNAVGEAMACACPVVATDVGGVRELVAETGVIVPPGDPAALARALAELLDAKERRTELGQQAHARVAEHFSIERMLQNTIRAWRAAAPTADQPIHR
jgi:glycosyltransferase involved in cell wall biosynthesis